MKGFNILSLVTVFVGFTATLAVAHASGAKLPNADKRIEWSKVEGSYALAPGSSASCDPQTDLQFDVVETTYEGEPTVMVYNVTGGERAGRPRAVFDRLNKGEESRTVDGVDGKHLQVDIQTRDGWTLVEKTALYGGVFNPAGPTLPKDYTEINYEFDLFNESVTTCRGAFEYHYDWKGRATACTEMTPIEGPCVYKRTASTPAPSPQPQPQPVPQPNPNPAPTPENRN